VRGLLREAERKNSWQGAEACGDSTPYGFQYWLARADWDADLGRDALRTSITQHWGDPQGVLVLDDTGLVRKGRHSAGVARPSPGTVGQVENGQIGVVLGSASPLGHALVARELDRPDEWTADRARGPQAGIPAARPLATKPPWARQLWARACTAGGPATGVTGDRGSGAERRLRLWLEPQRQADGLAVSGQD